MHPRYAPATALLTTLLLAVGPSRAPAAPPPGKAEGAKALDDGLRAELAKQTERLAGKDSLRDIAQATEGLFDAAILNLPTLDDSSILRDLAALRRQTRQLASLDTKAAESARALVVAHPRAARAVATTIGPGDNVAGAYTALSAIAMSFPERLDKAGDPKSALGAPKRDGKDDFSNLVAAMCVVYDGPAAKGASGGYDSARIEPVFRHLSTNWSRLLYAPSLPPELLVYVVAFDPEATDDDLAWAFKTYQGNRSVGKLYSSIVYDTAAFKQGKPKKVEQCPEGVTLQSIRKYGGVCHEQALFASNVARAIGVPAVYVSGSSSGSSHAWVGVFKPATNNRFEWDFDEGRYKDYQGLRGTVIDPRSLKPVSDGYVGLTASLATPGAIAQREQSIALLDAAERLRALEARPASGKPAGLDLPEKPARQADVATQLALIEQALRKAPANTRGWNMVADLAKAKKLSAEQLRVWSERLYDLCGPESPDYALEALTPMIAAVPEPAKQDEIWQWLGGKFSKRRDLAALTLLARADLWNKAGEPAKAWTMYTQICDQYANDGQVVVAALAAAERFMTSQNKADQVLDLYKRVWPKIDKPREGSGQWLVFSNYARVGSRYAALLDKAGKTGDAKSVRDAVKKVTDR